MSTDKNGSNARERRHFSPQQKVALTDLALTFLGEISLVRVQSRPLAGCPFSRRAQLIWRILARHFFITAELPIGCSIHAAPF
jgi:hypothetical protein